MLDGGVSRAVDSYFLTDLPNTMKPRLTIKNQDGFTLMELIVVILIT